MTIEIFEVIGPLGVTTTLDWILSEQRTRKQYLQMFCKLQLISSIKPFFTAAISYFVALQFTDQQLCESLLDMMHSLILAVSCDPDGPLVWHMSVAVFAQIFTESMASHGYSREMLGYFNKTAFVPILIRVTPERTRDFIVLLIANVQPVIDRYIPKGLFSRPWVVTELWPPLNDDMLNCFLSSSTICGSPHTNIQHFRCTAYADELFIRVENQPPRVMIKITSVERKDGYFEAIVSVPCSETHDRRMNVTLSYAPVTGYARLVYSSAKTAYTLYSAAGLVYGGVAQIGSVSKSLPQAIEAAQQSSSSALQSIMQIQGLVIEYSDDAAGVCGYSSSVLKAANKSTGGVMNAVAKTAQAVKDSGKVAAKVAHVACSTMKAYGGLTLLHSTSKTMVSKLIACQTVQKPDANNTPYFAVLRWLAENDYIYVRDGKILYSPQEASLLLKIYNKL
ncbi:hypothetical protein EON65_04800 [archaeon]|nr:MAG: hypothetical protein EON65_04800 [archaeon]